MTRRERLAALACVLLALAAVLMGCASPRAPAEQKPPDDYPCTDAQGKRVDCSADEWVHQEILRNRK